MAGFEGHAEEGRCHVCGRFVRTRPVIELGIAGPTCNMADDGRPPHSGEELRASFERVMRREPAPWSVVSTRGGYGGPWRADSTPTHEHRMVAGSGRCPDCGERW